MSSSEKETSRMLDSLGPSAALNIGQTRVIISKVNLRVLLKRLLLPPASQSPSTSYNSLNNAPNGPGIHMEQQEKTLLFCEFCFFRIFMNRANSHIKPYNIPRSLEAMHINIKYQLRASVTCGTKCF